MGAGLVWVQGVCGCVPPGHLLCESCGREIFTALDETERQGSMGP